MKPKQAHLRILSLLLCLSMIVGMAPMVQLFAPAAATAADPTEISGKVAALIPATTF